MTNHFAKLFPARIIPVLIATVMVLPEANSGPPFTQPDLVLRYKKRKKGEQVYESGNPRPMVIRRRRIRAKLNLSIELNGDLIAAATRRNVEVTVLGPRSNRLGTYQYFFNAANITSLIASGGFSGYVDPGLNFKGLTVRVTPRKRSSRRNRPIPGITIRAFDSEFGNVVDGVRAKLKKR